MTGVGQGICIGQSNAGGERSESECTWVYQTMQIKRSDQNQNRDANGSNRAVHAQGGL